MQHENNVINCFDKNLLLAKYFCSELRMVVSITQQGIHVRNIYLYS